MTKRLRLLLTITVASLTAIAVPGPSWDGEGLVWHGGEAQAQRRRRKPTKKPPAPAPTPTPAPAPTTPAPTESTPPAGEQQPVIEIEPEPGAAPAEAAPAAPSAAAEAAATPTEKDLQAAKSGVSWQDVVVVMRKPFLKQGRLELQPSWNVTLNDNMIRHHAASGQIIYWLTDVLAVGAEGQWFEHFGFLPPYDLVATAYRRVPTLNEYKWGAALDFHYAPIYAKFAVFNRFLVHWEGMFTAGVGAMQSEVLPRRPEDKGWSNLLIVPNVGFQARVFVTNWITIDLGVRDYIFVDKFENVNRPENQSATEAKSNATTQLINHVMFTAGFSFWIPTSFKYTTFR